MPAKSKLFFVIVNTRLEKVWAGGKLWIPGIGHGIKKLKGTKLADAIDTAAWGWTDDSGAREYTELSGAHKCPAWSVFKNVPHIHIEERQYDLVATKFHDFSSVKVDR